MLPPFTATKQHFRFTLIGVSLIALALNGCFSRLANINRTPELSPIVNPVEQEQAQIITMPMPDTVPQQRSANSLWRPGSRAFFKDLRASRVGDILTVAVTVSDRAQLSNQSSATRRDSTSSSITALGGLETTIQQLLPNAPGLSPLVGADGNLSTTGNGAISRSETIDMSVAAMVTQTLPNGNIVIYGRQELRVNNEIRELHVAGVIRPQDISASNRIEFDKIAEARVAYGGRGQITELQRPRWGTQVADIVLPF